MMFEGLGPGTPCSSFALEADITAFPWSENVWPVSVTDEAMEYIAEMISGDVDGSSV